MAQRFGTGIEWAARTAVAGCALWLLAACGGGHGSGVSCAPDICGPFYTLGGSLSGLAGTGTGLQFQNGFTPGGTFEIPLKNGTGIVFTANGVLANTPYDVTVLSQPIDPAQTCVVANGTGIAGSANVTNIAVTCTINPPRFVYVTNEGSNSVSAFAVDATGSLTPIAGSPFAAGGQPDAIAVNPAGSFAFVANHADATISVFSIDRTNGVLTPVTGSPFATGAEPTSVAVDPSFPIVPSGAFLDVASGAANAVFVYGIDASSGALSAVSGSPYAVGMAPRALTVDPAQQRLYVANEGDGTLSTFYAYSSGELAGISGSPIAAESSPCAISIDPTDDFVYVANCTSNDVAGYTISGTVGDLSLANELGAGTDPVSIAADSLGRFVYAANADSNNISGYSISKGLSGYLKPLAGSPYAAGSAPSSVAIDPTGRFTFVVNSGSDTIAVYAIDQTTGALSAVQGPYATGDLPSAMAISE